MKGMRCVRCPNARETPQTGRVGVRDITANPSPSPNAALRRWAKGGLAFLFSENNGMHLFFSVAFLSPFNRLLASMSSTSAGKLYAGPRRFDCTHMGTADSHNAGARRGTNKKRVPCTWHETRFCSVSPAGEPIFRCLPHQNCDCRHLR